MLTLRVACLLFVPQSGQPSVSRELLQGWAEACWRFTPQIAVSREAIFLEIGKCRSVYREDWLGLRLQALGKRLAVGSYRWAIAADVPTALALARLGLFSGGAGERVLASGLPISALRDYADPFGFEAGHWEPALSHLLETLEKLGVSTLGAFLALPPGKLPSRFGKLGILMHQRIREAVSLPWPSFSASEKIVERGQFEPEESFRDLEPLLTALIPWVDRAMSRLRGRGRRASKVRLLIELERYSFSKTRLREWTWELALPQGTTSALLPILRERLSSELQRAPLAAPVLGLEFEVLEFAPGRGSQRDLFDLREEEREAWNSLLGRLVEKLGRARVFQAVPVERYLPERAWERRLSESGQERVGPEPLWKTAERPLRILKEPEPLQRQGEWLCRQGSPVWRVFSVEGPEVISGEWWFQQPQRSYFRVQVERAELWVYRVPGVDTLFLQGVFD